MHFFKAPRDLVVTGFKSRIFTKDGQELPGQYLHHILLQNLEEKSLSCPGEPSYFAGAGIEVTDAKFPEGYGVPIKKNSKLIAVVAFYHKVPVTKDVMATFTMELAPEGVAMKPVKAYTVGVNVVCYSQFNQRPANESDEGRALLLDAPAPDRWPSLLALGEVLLGRLDWWPQITADAGSSIIGALANAISDALAPYGVVAEDQPFTPERLVTLIRTCAGQRS